MGSAVGGNQLAINCVVVVAAVVLATSGSASSSLATHLNLATKSDVNSAAVTADAASSTTLDLDSRVTTLETTVGTDQLDTNGLVFGNDSLVTAFNTLNSQFQNTCDWAYHARFAYSIELQDTLNDYYQTAC